MTWRIGSSLVLLLWGGGGLSAQDAKVWTVHVVPPIPAPGWSGMDGEAAVPSALLRLRTARREAAPEEARVTLPERALRQSRPAAPTFPETTLTSRDELTSFEVGLHRVLDEGELGGTRETSVVEPTVAGDEILLVTGNHFAALSQDDGSSFRPVDPDRFLTTVPELYCCDQVTAYDPDRRLLAWLIQYERGPRGNRLRLAVSAGEDRAAGRFMEYDLIPEELGWSEGNWFDFSDLVVGQRHLFLTTMVADWRCPTDVLAGAVVRLPLDALARYQEMEVTVFSVPEVSLRATRGAGSEVVLATHWSGESLKVWRWPDEDSEPTPGIEVLVEPWSEPSHDRSWLSRADGTLLAGWANDRHVGFAWIGGADGSYPRPHVRVAILDREALQLVAQPHLWSGTVDFAYPSLAPNRVGTLGVTVQLADDDGYPGHAVGILVQPCGPGEEWRWELLQVAGSSASPAGARWGDYIVIARDAIDADGWLTASYTLDSQRSPRVHITRFRSKR